MNISYDIHLVNFTFVEYSWCVKYTEIEWVRENSLFDACVLYVCMFKWTGDMRWQRAEIISITTIIMKTYQILSN